MGSRNDAVLRLYQIQVTGLIGACTLRNYGKAARARKRRGTRTACTDCAVAHADRCCPQRTPCTGCAGARAHRCWLPHTPCINCAAARVGRHCPHRTPCIECASARAGTFCVSSTTHPASQKCCLARGLAQLIGRLQINSSWCYVPAHSTADWQMYITSGRACAPLLGS